MKYFCVHAIVLIGKMPKFKGVERVNFMKNLNQYKHTIWKIPLIYLVAGVLYIPLRFIVVLIFGEAGISSNLLGLLINSVYFLLVFFWSYSHFLKNMTQKEIFVSAAVISLYGIVLVLLQRITGCTTGSGAIVFTYLHAPLEWAISRSIGLFLGSHISSIFYWITYLAYLEPFLFLLFGETENSSDRES